MHGSSSLSSTCGYPHVPIPSTNDGERCLRHRTSRPMKVVNPLSLALIGGFDAVLQCQNGLIRRDQALAAGFAEATIESLVRRGTWPRVLPRVYSVSGELTDPRVRIRAGWLWAGEDAVVGAQAAAFWLGLTDTPPGSIRILVPPHRRMTVQPGFVVTRAKVDPVDAVERDRITVTTPARTCLDLARLGVEDRLEAALRQRRLNQGELQTSLELGRGTRGQRRARTARASAADNPWSQPERAAHRLLRSAGITGWTGNTPVTTQDGIRYPDILFDKVKLLVEIDGRAHHSSPEAFEADRRRQNQLVLAGWTVLRFTPQQLAERPADVVALIRGTIARLQDG